MKPKDFIRQAQLLTGSDVKGHGQIDHESLAAILRDDSTPLDWSHLNELLLLVHKDRVEKPFFDHFFGPDCTVGCIPSCVAGFQEAALLLYGNFIFAYRTLSRIKDPDEFSEKVASTCKDPKLELEALCNRRRKLLEVDRISRDLTPFVGYLSMRNVPEDLRSCEFLLAAVKAVEPTADWDRYIVLVGEMTNPGECKPLLEIVQNFRAFAPEADLCGFRRFLEHSFELLNCRKKEVEQVRARAARNQDVYLTWDHMDVYFATSMRKAWEYMDLYDFIDQLMASEEFRDLGVRYFDPTQAYTDNRINKGLVEALMLKRARCTVYSVQDTDTLGKDSELASTLAQGKPVIAYVPDVDVGRRASQLFGEDPVTVLERMRFVLYADDQLADRLTDEEYGLVSRVQDDLAEYCSKRIWLSMADSKAAARLRDTLGDELLEFCRIVARSEKAVYDKRAGTLKDSHPLALQVNLATGVANRVLLVRTIPACAALLRGILLSDMKFALEEKDGMWLLCENISGCIHRVVTNDALPEVHHGWQRRDEIRSSDAEASRADAAPDSEPHQARGTGVRAVHGQRHRARRRGTH